MSTLPTLVTRSWDRLRNRFQHGVHQRSHVTEINRYPALFAAAREQLETTGIDAPRLLSFGCSSGEECLSLRSVFPRAHIVGAEVSPRIMTRARRACAHDPGIEIVVSRPAILADRAPFDVIFALSVLCRHRETRKREDCARVYPFEDFDAAVGRLAGTLAPGGLLVLYNTNYHFEDTSVAPVFDDVTPATIRESGHVAKFDRSGHRSSAQAYRACLFRKRPA